MAVRNGSEAFEFLGGDDISDEYEEEGANYALIPFPHMTYKIGYKEDARIESGDEEVVP